MIEKYSVRVSSRTHKVYQQENHVGSVAWTVLRLSLGNGKSSTSRQYASSSSSTSPTRRSPALGGWNSLATDPTSSGETSASGGCTTPATSTRGGITDVVDEGASTGAVPRSSLVRVSTPREAMKKSTDAGAHTELKTTVKWRTPTSSTRTAPPPSTRSRLRS